MKTALIIVDVQQDYIDGKMTIPYSMNIIKGINKITKEFDNVYITKCINKQINNKPGWELKISDVEFYLNDEIGCELLIKNHPIYERSYSKSFDALCGELNNKTLLEKLKDDGITDVYVCGLPGDYSVKSTLISCKLNGFKSYLILDLVKTIGTLDFLTRKIIENEISIVQSIDISFMLKMKKMKFRKNGNKNDDETKKSKDNHDFYHANGGPF